MTQTLSLFTVLTLLTAVCACSSGPGGKPLPDPGIPSDASPDAPDPVGDNDRR